MPVIPSFLFTVILAVVMFANAPAVYSAGFDCKRAKTEIERLICSQPELSALDDELTSVYKQALKLGSDEAGLKKAQARWIKEERNPLKGPDDIEAAYLARIEAIRLDPKFRKQLFARSAPPASVFGRYSETEPMCSEPKKGAEEYDCGDDAETYIDLWPGPGNSVLVKGELYFFGGFQCGPFEAEGEWIDGTLRCQIWTMKTAVSCFFGLRITRSLRGTRQVSAKRPLCAEQMQDFTTSNCRS